MKDKVKFILAIVLCLKTTVCMLLKVGPLYYEQIKIYRIGYVKKTVFAIQPWKLKNSWLLTDSLSLVVPLFDAGFVKYLFNLFVIFSQDLRF